MTPTPRIAIIHSNTLSCLGLKSVLESVFPFVVVDFFSDFGQFHKANSSSEVHYFHFFVSFDTLLEQREYFQNHKRQTFVIASHKDSDEEINAFHPIYQDDSAKDLLKRILSLIQGAHAHGHNLPQMQSTEVRELSDRERQVLVLIVKGSINKQIADELNIALSTVVTHRHNIMQKLHARSVSSLAVYAVMNGLVEAKDI